jgi:hypothetical protein
MSRRQLCRTKRVDAILPPGCVGCTNKTGRSSLHVVRSRNGATSFCKTLAPRAGARTGASNSAAIKTRARRRSSAAAARARQKVPVRIARPTSVNSKLAPVATRVGTIENQATPTTRSRTRSPVSTYVRRCTTGRGSGTCLPQRTNVMMMAAKNTLWALCTAIPIQAL